MKVHEVSSILLKLYSQFSNDPFFSSSKIKTCSKHDVALDFGDAWRGEDGVRLCEYLYVFVFVCVYVCVCVCIMKKEEKMQK